MSRATWGSKLGFVLAVAGSAIGLANIWRFPYIVGVHGGAAFIAVYLMCLLLIGIPVFMAELVIGRATQRNPKDAFQILGKSKTWGWAGGVTIATGFIVSAFYSVIAGWVLGYFFEALYGHVSSLKSLDEATNLFSSLTNTPWWGFLFHFLFVLASTLVLYCGVRAGIEKSNKYLLPLLFLLLLLLVVKGLTMPNAMEGLVFLFAPNFKALTPAAILTALGHSFFTLSLGQGTMVTYGSYLKKNENLMSGSIPVVIMDTLVSLLAAVAVFTIVFSQGIRPESGPALIFHSLPWVFSEIPGGYAIAVMFFLLIVLAALTSQISAMEPLISYLVDKKQMTRQKASVFTGITVFLCGVPCALATSVLKEYTFFGKDILDLVSSFAGDVLIPVSGFFAVVLVGWRWGVGHAVAELARGAENHFERKRWVKTYFWFCFKYSAPILIIFIFLHALGAF